MSKVTVKDLDVKGKHVIVRVDFNVPHKGDTITDDNRIRAALPTINYLTENGAKVLLLSHLGKIKTDEDKAKNDMSIVAKRLAELTSAPVKFVNATRGAELEEAVKAQENGSIVLMQNTRYEKGETKNDPELGKYWASLGDAFVEDAFGSVHRAHASTVGIPSNMKEVAVGFLVEKELNVLGKALNDPQRPFVAILGGAKVSDKIGVIENLLKIADKVLIGGGMSYTFAAANGGKIGTSLLEADKEDLAKEFMEKGKGKLFLPVDTVIANDFDNPTDIKTVKAGEIPDGYMGLDIGPATVAEFQKELAGAKTVFWNGPMGVFEKPEFAKGTEEICKTLAELDGATTIIGGGDSASAAKNLGYADKFSHISTGGGASLEYMEGKELPGVAIIPEK
ncbi:phosphoglycerate kinase [Erysipelotrichaceae bacterium Oil+RF-744-GAM-WT-6]|jgi:phosphoglycerate kinase|uniref:Phosphoglycerate kinase n=1 Tax=Stecheria intestinalis TaxID=2606630 RepID=A0A7X2THG7_9FIRM|nr:MULTISPECIES: phosphoglycerate kinase [Erysipelotrichaceae]MCI2154254.1 phosphoglycerate kinase [Solobacterium sp.]MDY3233584.1 phosphoglycerate kinase [Erysipelotrichaceae bacterium]MDY4682656.1 phosphoglycerate kinase [Lachnospiraceae bacterium]MCI6745145.1 phosphoglycerate kinase [Anaerolactibacter massiliensis]MDD5880947.1 phosphoglycerate kinase [Stecheria intestinalis]